MVGWVAGQLLEPPSRFGQFPSLGDHPSASIDATHYWDKVYDAAWLKYDSCQCHCCRLGWEFRFSDSDSQDPKLEPEFGNLEFQTFRLEHFGILRPFENDLHIEREGPVCCVLWLVFYTTSPKLIVSPHLKARSETIMPPP